jgi:hypothetical protein
VERRGALGRYLWALPATLVGLVLATFARVLGARAVVVDGTLEVGGGRLSKVLWKLPRAFHFGAITFGHVIVGVDQAALDRSRSHERVHVRQYEKFGIFFFPAYLGSSLRQLLAGRHPYSDNRFEKEADRLSKPG